MHRYVYVNSVYCVVYEFVSLLDQSHCLSSILPALPTAPTEPLMPVASTLNSTAIMVSWKPPPLIGRNGPNISYIVEYGWSGGMKAVAYSANTSKLIGGLSPYIPYQFRVAAVSVNNETGSFTRLFSGNITRSKIQLVLELLLLLEGLYTVASYNNVPLFHRHCKLYCEHFLWVSKWSLNACYLNACNCTSCCLHSP